MIIDQMIALHSSLHLVYFRQTTTTNYKSRIFFWDKKKEDTPDVIERKQRLVVPNHLVPFGPKVRERELLLDSKGYML